MEEKELKIILLGESGVGKSSIILRYYKNVFNPNLPSTFGSTFIIKSIERENITYKLNIWDTTGQEKYHSVTKLFINGADIAILVYAINDVDSFKKLDYWHKEIKDNCDKNAILGIVGNKYDLFSTADPIIPDEEGENYTKEKNALFKLVSAKDDKVGIDSLFEELLDEYIAKGSKKLSDNKEEKEKSIKIEQKKEKKNTKKGSCCWRI